MLQIAHNSAILVNNAVKCWNTLWQYSCDGPNALPDGGAFFYMSIWGIPMNAQKRLIIIKGKDKTDSVASFRFRDGK